MEAEAVKGKEMMKPCPSSVCGFSLLVCPHPWLTHIPTTLFITSSHTLPLCVIPGSSLRGGGVFVPVPLQALGRTQEGSIAGWFPQESQLPFPEQVQGKEPSEATSRSKFKPSIQTTPCCLCGICNTTWAALPLALPHYCLCIVYILYIYI